MEAGERWMLNDVGGNRSDAWDSRGHQFRNEYDALRRPVRSFVQGADRTIRKRRFVSRRLFTVTRLRIRRLR